MGAGRSTLGRNLADHRKSSPMDCDEESEPSRGRSVTETLASEAETNARRVEAREIAALTNAGAVPGPASLPLIAGLDEAARLESSRRFSMHAERP